MEAIDVVSELNLSAPSAKRIIAEIITDSARVFFTPHAEARMKERKITATQVFNCLRRGQIIEGPARDVKGNWKVTVETLAAGDPVRVVLALDRDGQGNYILIITTY